MFFTKWSIKSKLIFAFTIVLLLPTLAVSLFSYNNTKSLISESQLSASETNLHTLNTNITNIIQPKMQHLNYFSSYISKDMTVQSDKINSLLDEYLATNSDVSIAYIGTVDGQMLRRPAYQYDKDFDPRERPWYIQAIEANGEVIITDPYIAKGSGALVTTIAQQLKDKSGVIGIDITIQELSEIVSSVAIGEKGYAMLLDNANNYMAAPNVEIGSVADESFLKNLVGNNGVINEDKTKTLYSKHDLTGWTILATT